MTHPDRQQAPSLPYELDALLAVRPGSPELEVLLEGPLIRVVAPDTYTRLRPEADRIVEEIESGNLPPLGYFNVVSDQSEEAPIPGGRSAVHFASGQVPLVAQGREVHRADATWLIGYGHMFQSPLCAVVVAGAAQNAAAGGEYDQQSFSEALEALTGSVLDLLEGSLARYTHENATLGLESLIEQYLGRQPDDVMRNRIYHRLYEELGLRDME